MPAVNYMILKYVDGDMAVSKHKAIAGEHHTHGTGGMIERVKYDKSDHDQRWTPMEVPCDLNKKNEVVKFFEK